MLAGRKLLLADDSITIQKVVDLTFADEGVEVVTVSNGADCLEKLEEISPDVVLADVFMPGMTGYEVCEYIKKNEIFKRIPVMLLVGSFEPFDEAEARRVGADDTLSKPFQSIRNLVDKVSTLLGGGPAQSQTPVSPTDSEHAQVIEPQAHPEAVTAPLRETATYQTSELDDAELQVRTADTRPLATDLFERTMPETAFVGQEAPSAINESAEAENTLETSELDHSIVVPKPVEHLMEEQTFRETRATALEDFGDALLDLGHFEPVAVAFGEDAVLELDHEQIHFDDSRAEILAAPEYRIAESPAEVSFAEPIVSEPVEWQMETIREEYFALEQPPVETAESFVEEPEPVSSPALGEHLSEEAIAQEAVPAAGAIPAAAAVAAAPAIREPETAFPANEPPAVQAARIDVTQLPQEVIDVIARRAVEQLSEKAIQEIAWEIVPQLAELLIKRRLEEREAQLK